MKYELTDGDHRLVFRARIALAYAAEDGRSVHDAVHEQSVRGLMGLLIRILDAEGVCDPDETGPSAHPAGVATSARSVKMPERIQLRRVKGWRMPPNTVKVDRSSHRWGNAWVVWRDEGQWLVTFNGCQHHKCDSKADATAYAVEQHRAWWHEHWHLYGYVTQLLELRGKNLACWCPLDQPCHADVLLDLANR